MKKFKKKNEGKRLDESHVSDSFVECKKHIDYLRIRLRKLNLSNKKLLKDNQLLKDQLQKRPFKTPVSIQIEGILSSRNAECMIRKVADILIPAENFSPSPESEINYHLLIRNLKEGVVIVNQNESIVYINPAGELIFGEPSGAFKDRNLRELINSDKLKNILGKTDSWERGEEINLEVDVVTSNAETKILNISCLPYFDSKGIGIGAQLIITDKTTRRRKNMLNEKYSIVQRNLGFTLGTTTTIRQALFHIIHSMLQIMEIHAAGVYLINQQSGELELIEHKGFSSEFIDSIRHSILGQVYSHSVYPGVPIYGLYDEIFEVYGTFTHENLKQFGVIPIMHEDKIIGSVIIASKEAKRLKYKSKIALEIIASQIGRTLARIKSEDALKLSQKNFQLMFNAINDFMIILDTEGKIIIANPVVEQSLGYTQAELQGMSIFDLHHPEKRDEITYIFDKMLIGQLTVCSIPFYKRNGEFIPVETKAVLGMWDGKDSLYCISRDISGRQEAESRLKMQSSAFEALTLAIIITDIKGNIQWANSSFARISGYTISEIIGKNSSQLVKSGKHDSAFYQTMWETILSGKVWSGELINKRKDGSFFPEELTISPMVDHTGAIISFIAIKVDISSRKEMEVALRISEERWHFALEVSGESVWDWNMMTNEIFFSDQGKIMLGYSVSEIENKPGQWEKHVYPDDLELCLDKLNKYLNGEAEFYVCEYRMQCKDGNYIWVHDRGKIIEWTTEGKPMRIIGTHKNITNSKLYEEQLKKGIEKEKDLNELKSRFVATTSHEFRTPLASILMISDTLISHHQKMNMAQMTAKLTKIKNHVLHLTDIVNNVLQISKMQEGKMGFNPKNVDMIDICLHIIEGFNMGELFKDQIRFSSPFKTLIVKIDKLLIIQSINNLISNALKYSPENSLVDIELNLGKDELILMVRDKGIGIPPKDIKHLFTPFFRASNSSTIQGNGLGLSIVRETLLLHKGTVSCSNNTDNGATFNLHFPLELISSYSFNHKDS